jgi:hypothetical protein
MKAAKVDRRIAQRENLEPLQIKGFTSLDHRTMVARVGKIVEASKTGFCLHINRKDLLPKQFREALSLAALEGDRIMLVVDQMDLELSGTVKRTNRKGKDVYEIGVDYSEEAPEYWRECLMDLLPRPGEMKDDEE